MRALLLLPWLAGCAAETLSQSWQLDRLRILAVQAEPAEPQPGDTVAFRSLVYVPFGQTLAGVLWFACLPSSADDFGCQLDPAITDALSGSGEDLSPEEQAALFQQAKDAGLIGFEPILSPSWQVPEDALEGLTEAEQVEGVSATINLTALPEDAEDDGDVEIAYKRLPISRATTPNHNPAFNGLLFEDARGDAVEQVEGYFRVAQGQTYTITPLLTAGSIEDYVYVTSAGVAEDRTEEPFATWYAEGGSFDQTFSLHPYLDVEWTSPDKGFEGLVLAVLRDRRGGMAWLSIPISTASPDSPTAR
jgi:hypothetical protein